MTREDLLQRISIDPKVCFGKPCIRGTRIQVALIIENLAAGVPEAEILEAYPALTLDDIQAALAYATSPERLASDQEQMLPELRRLWDESSGNSSGRKWTREELHERRDIADET